MGARRFFVLGERSVGDSIPIEGPDAHKIASVLRLHIGDALEIVDSASQLFDAKLERVEGVVVAALVAKRDVAHASPVVIDVAQGIPKGAKMDYVVEKLTELGASSILPLESERTIVRDVSGPKLQRWQRIAQTSAQQCGRMTIPEIGAPVTLLKLIERFDAYDLVLLPWEAADAVPPREILPGLVEDRKRILVLIGPEGGFSHGEADAAVAAGAHAISLGKRILRTETAALVVLSVLGYIVQ